MTLGHFHLAFCHLPVFAVPFTLIFFIYALIKKQENFKKFSLILLALASLSAVPVYFTGEDAEELAEHLPGVTKVNIETHEQAAKFGLIWMSITGFLCLVSLVIKFSPIKTKALDRVIVAVCFLGCTTLFRIAFLGGHVRHIELNGSEDQMETNTQSAPPETETE